MTGGDGERKEAERRRGTEIKTEPECPKSRFVRSCTKVKSVGKSCLLPGTWSVF